MMVIQVKYLPCTNTKGSRFKASFVVDGIIKKSVISSYDYSLDHEMNVKQCAQKMISSMGFSNEWSMVYVPGPGTRGRGFWLFVPSINIETL